MDTRPNSDPTRKAALILEQGVKHLVRSAARVSPEMREIAPNAAALKMVSLAVEHIRAIISLAQSGSVSSAPGATLERALIEIGVRALWMVDHNEPMMRMQKWLVFAEEDIRARRRIQAIKSTPVEDAETDERHHLVSEIRALMSKVDSPLAGVPSFEQMVREVNLKSLSTAYPIYILGSQVVHGTFWGASTQATAEKRLPAVSAGANLHDTSFWEAPLTAAALTMGDPLLRVMVRLGIPSGCVFPQGYRAQLFKFPRLFEINNSPPRNARAPV